MKISIRAILASAGLAVSVIMLSGLFSYHTGRTLLNEEVRNKLDAVANSRRETFIDVIQAWRDRATLIGSRTQMRISLSHYLRTGEDESLKRVIKILTDAVKSTQAVQQITVESLEGETLAVIGKAEEAEVKKTRLLDEWTNPKVESLYLSNDSRLFVQLRARLMLEEKDLADLLVTMSADELIAATSDFTGLGESGETMLLGKNQSGIFFHVNPLRHQEPSILDPLGNDNLTTSLIHGDTVASAQFHPSIEDYRGVPVTAATKNLDELNWVLVAKMDRNEFLSPITKFGQQLIAIALILISLSILSGYFLSRPLSRPLEKLAQIAEMIKAGDKTARANMENIQTYEIRLLAENFNSMADELVNSNQLLEQRVKARTKELAELNTDLEDRVTQRTEELQNTNSRLTDTLSKLKATQKELVDKEKMASLGSLVAGIAHEINTPLGISITANTHLNEQTQSVASATEKNAITKQDLVNYLCSTKSSCELMNVHLSRAAELINDFKQIAVDQSNPDIRPISLNRYISKVLSTLAPNFKNSEIETVVDIADDLEITSCPGALAQAITAVISNCLTHAFDQEMISTPRIKISAKEEDGKCLLIVEDNGAGISEDDLPRIFDPFYTTKRGAGGSGLGLSLVYNITTEILSGKIWCESVKGKGSCFNISLPLDIQIQAPPSQKVAQVSSVM